MIRARKPSAQTLAVLDALLAAAPAWRHGYDLIANAGLSSGTLYPLLIRLADRGLLETRWEAATHPGRPPRHLYRLTSAGIAYATEQLAADGTWNRTGDSRQRDDPHRPDALPISVPLLAPGATALGAGYARGTRSHMRAGRCSHLCRRLPLGGRDATVR